jgi:hypothetical protein
VRLDVLTADYGWSGRWGRLPADSGPASGKEVARQPTAIFYKGSSLERASKIQRVVAPIGIPHRHLGKVFVDHRSDQLAVLRHVRAPGHPEVVVTKDEARNVARC